MVHPLEMLWCPGSPETEGFGVTFCTWINTRCPFLLGLLFWDCSKWISTAWIYGFNWDNKWTSTCWASHPKISTIIPFSRLDLSTHISWKGSPLFDQLQQWITTEEWWASRRKQHFGKWDFRFKTTVCWKVGKEGRAVSKI